jgi:hypothetical protein
MIPIIAITIKILPNFVHIQIQNKPGFCKNEQELGDLYAYYYYTNNQASIFLANLLPSKHIGAISYQRTYQTYHYLVYHQNICQEILLYLSDNLVRT